MLKGEVVTILGEPSGEQDSDYWLYEEWPLWCFVVVKFDGAGRVILVDHDH